MMTPIETLKQHKTAIAALEDQRQKIWNRMSPVSNVEQEVKSVRQQIQQATTKRRSLLGRLFLGEPVDVATVDAELSEAQQQAAALEPTAEGAAAAREVLQAQVDALNQQAAELRTLTPALQYACLRSEVGKLATDYMEAVETMEAAFLTLAGAASATNETANPRDGRPYCFDYAAQQEIMVPHLRLSEMEHFKHYRRLCGKAAQFEAAFTEQMRQAGVL